MAGKTFTAQLADFEKLTTQNLKYVAVEAIQDVVSAAQTAQRGITLGATSFVEGKIPEGKTKNLKNSLTSNGTEGVASYTVAIGAYEVGDTLTFAWTAPYALRMELGFTGTDIKGRTYNQAGRHFVGANARKFPEFVAARVKEVQ